MVPQTNGANKPKDVPIYLGQKVMAYVKMRDGKLTLYKYIDGRKHILNSPRAICLDNSMLRDAAAAGATWIEIFDTASRKTYTTTFETFDKHSFAVVRKHGSQRGLLLDFWSVDGTAPLVESRATQTHQELADLQMSLFGESA